MYTKTAELYDLFYDWMNGIQFYLARSAPIVHGHIVYADSPWALTSVSQDQFWAGIDLSEYGDGNVRGMAWDFRPEQVSQIVIVTDEHEIRLIVVEHLVERLHGVAARRVRARAAVHAPRAERG